MQIQLIMIIISKNKHLMLTTLNHKMKKQQIALVLGKFVATRHQTNFIADGLAHVLILLNGQKDLSFKGPFMEWQLMQ